MTARNVLLSALVAGCLLSGAAQAAIVEYTDRAAWLAAIGGATGGENFNGFVADTSFDGGALALASGMTIGSVAPVGENFIDVAPQFAGGVYSIDGSPLAVLRTGHSAPGGIPYISFAPAIIAFGADFFSINNELESGLEQTEVQLLDGATLLATLDVPVAPILEQRFLGFVATAGETITGIRFLYVQDTDLFSLDNIEIGRAGTQPPHSDVPEPGTLALLGLGLAGIGFQLRRRRR
ncbi:PEP-CTERM sorting domain-containing protein [Desertibaculum subflavum]|uniref:PEP-CTERM sorting domain-containing protein n=1 Tax=Desertibaculum subflavum TaxID=2268458 RepID=UPI000E662C28